MEYTDMPANLQDEKAKRLYMALCEEYLRTHGVEEIPDSSMALLTDIATMEQIKSKLLKEIENRPMDHIRNGRQEYWKPNGAIGEVNRLVSSQRRNLAELKLTPASRKGSIDAPTDDDFSAY